MAASIDQILARIAALKGVIASGVEGAGYGDKRTDFRSLNELRQILAGLEDELAELTGQRRTSRHRKVITYADKGL
jgi:hypothetical protein